jgi:hypothetical protein
MTGFCKHTPVKTLKALLYGHLTFSGCFGFSAHFNVLADLVLCACCEVGVGVAHRREIDMCLPSRSAQLNGKK